MDVSGHWVGIDVSKTHLDVFAGGRHRRFRIADEFDDAVSWVNESKPQGVVLEATGGYEQRIAKALEASHRVAVVNPLHVRNFAKSRGRLAKTDKFDARLLAEFGAVNQPRATRSLSDVEVRLRAAVQRRDQVADLRQLAKQHVEHTDDPTMLRLAKELVATLHEEVRKLDAVVANIINEDAALKARAKRMRTVPGIGAIIAAALLVYLPELGTISKGQIAALAGLAPMNCDSGMMRGQRHIRGGRFRVRKSLFIAATVNQRCKISRFKDQFLALTARAKPPKVARIAVARKILVALNSMLKNGTDYAAAGPVKSEKAA